MTRSETLKAAGRQAGEAKSIVAGLYRARLLHAASLKPTGPVEGWNTLHDRGCAMDRQTVSRMLKRMEGHGWLKRIEAGRGRRGRVAYSLSPEGRRVLNAVREHLKQLLGRWGAEE